MTEWGGATAETPLLDRRPLAEVTFAVMDVETTGWSPPEARVTEVAAVRVRARRVLAEFATLVDPGILVPRSIELLTGITNSMVAAAPPPAIVLPALLGFVDGCVLAAHNAPFDVGFLAAACRDCGLTWPDVAVLDTAALARRLLATSEVPDCRLVTLASFFGAPHRPRHRALADARATVAVLHALLDRLAARGVGTLAEVDAWLAVP